MTNSPIILISIVKDPIMYGFPATNLYIPYDLVDKKDVETLVHLSESKRNKLETDQFLKDFCAKWSKYSKPICSVGKNLIVKYHIVW